MEQRPGNPHANTIAALAEVLRCNVDDLFRRNPRWRGGAA
jgi:hypothetical protein